MGQLLEEKGVLTGRHVALALAGFFGAVFGVNAYFIKVALSTHSGIVADEPYRKGLKYNDRIAASQKQATLGWIDVIELAPDSSKLAVSLRDRRGEPVRGLSVSVTIGRASTTREDVALILSETSPGQYVAPLTLPGAGSYVVSVEARSSSLTDADVLYRARSRVWLKH